MAGNRRANKARNQAYRKIDAPWHRNNVRRNRIRNRIARKSRQRNRGN